jgi:hypothetical protein
MLIAHRIRIQWLNEAGTLQCWFRSLQRGESAFERVSNKSSFRAEMMRLRIARKVSLASAALVRVISVEIKIEPRATASWLQSAKTSETEIIAWKQIKMKCSLIHLIPIIMLGSVVDGIDLARVDVKVLQPRGIQFTLKGLKTLKVTPKRIAQSNFLSIRALLRSGK